MADETHSIQSFIDKFNGGTRVNRFEVTGQIKSKNTSGIAALSSTVTKFHIKSATLPESVINSISMNWRGRTINFPGDRQYAPWQIVVVDDTGDKNELYKAFHEWHNDMNDHAKNISSDTNKPAIAKNSFSPVDWSVKQLDPNGAVQIKEFKLKNCWPIAIGALQLDMSQDNTIAAFAVTMKYSHYEAPDFTTKSV
jgi:hypothetical protein